MKLSGFWCAECGSKWGLLPRKEVAVLAGAEYAKTECDGCGDTRPCIPAHKYKISVAAARAAIQQRGINNACQA